MSFLLIAATLAATPVESYTSHSIAAEALDDEVQTGTLLFNRGDCLAIKVFTKSPYTHVAAVVVEQGTPYVYDSMNGVGVRRLPLDRYLNTQRPDVIHVFQPAEPFTKERTATFKHALESQLGRPYAIKHHLTGKRCEGLHCSEYVTDALQSSRLIKARRPPKVSPASLVEGIVKSDLYVATQMIQVKEPQQPIERGDNWCEQTWIDTKVCTTRCCRKMRRWFLCH